MRSLDSCLHWNFLRADMTEAKELRTIKRVAEVTGASERFLVQLLTEGKLTRYKINTATYISLIEFEQLAKPITKQNTKS